MSPRKQISISRNNQSNYSSKTPKNQDDPSKHSYYMLYNTPCIYKINIPILESCTPDQCDMWSKLVIQHCKYVCIEISTLSQHTSIYMYNLIRNIISNLFISYGNKVSITNLAQDYSCKYWKLFSLLAPADLLPEDINIKRTLCLVRDGLIGWIKEWL